MARMVTRSRPPTEGFTGLKMSEIIVIILVIGAIVMGVRYYINYRHSAGYALGQFLGYVKAGNASHQYELLDDEDKQKYLPTLTEYERNVNLAHGYTERIEDMTIAKDVPDPKDPNVATVPVTVKIRATSTGKELYQTGSSDHYSDNIKMRKDKDGNWKVWYSASIDRNLKKPQLRMEQAEPSPNSLY